MDKYRDAYYLSTVKSPATVSSKHHIGINRARTQARIMTETSYRHLCLGIYHAESDELVAIAYKGEIFEK